MDRKLAEPSHQLIDKICDQREGGVLLWHSLLIGNGRGESHCMRIVSIHYVLGSHRWETPRLLSAAVRGGDAVGPLRRKMEMRTEMAASGSQYFSKGSFGLHSAEGFHGVLKIWHGGNAPKTLQVLTRAQMAQTLIKEFGIKDFVPLLPFYWI